MKAANPATCNPLAPAGGGSTKSVHPIVATPYRIIFF